MMHAQLPPDCDVARGSDFAKLFQHDPKCKVPIDPTSVDRSEGFSIENHQFPIEMGWDGMDSGDFRGLLN